MAKTFSFGSSSRTSVVGIRHMKVLENQTTFGKYRIVNNPPRKGR